MPDFKINANKIFVYLLIISAQELVKKKTFYHIFPMHEYFQFHPYLFYLYTVSNKGKIREFLMKIDVDSPLDSYSLAAMARTEDALGFLIQGLGVVGSKDAFKNILYGVRLVVKGKIRRLTDFFEIVKMEEGKKENP